MAGVYLGARPALLSARLVSSEESRCLQCDSILVLSPLELQDKPLFGCHITCITFKKVPDWKVLDKPMDHGH